MSVTTSLSADASGGTHATPTDAEVHSEATASQTTASQMTASQMAASLGIADALVMRRIGSSRWAHLGGLGKGSSWAGIIELDAARDPLTLRIPRQIGAVEREQFTEPARVMGPYYAASGATVRVSPDVAVIFGSSEHSLADVHDVELLRLAQLVDSRIDQVQPSKRLADELEVLAAVRELMAAPIDAGLKPALQYMMTVATDALSCEVGVSCGANGKLTIVRDHSLSSERWREIFADITGRVDDDLWCAQDMTSAPSRMLAAAMPNARSMLVATVPPPVGGHLLFIHTSENPRGFTQQCRRICQAILDAGLVIVQSAMMHDELRAAADQASATARTDPLTGLGNRLAWDEAVARAQESVDQGATYSVVSVDVDGLKDINDRYGHNEGDELLRRCADVIRAHCSDDDLAVRIGGDEFAILVPHALDDVDQTYVDFTLELSGLQSTRDTVAASLGVCTVHTGESLFDGVREADMRMYGNKQRRRRQRRRQRE